MRVLGAEDSQPQEGPRARAPVRHSQVPQAAGRPPGRSPPGRSAVTAAVTAAAHRGRGAGRPRRRHRDPRARGAAVRPLARSAPADARAPFSGASTAGGCLLDGGRCTRGSGRERCAGRPCLRVERAEAARPPLPPRRAGAGRERGTAVPIARRGTGRNLAAGYPGQRGRTSRCVFGHAEFGSGCFAFVRWRKTPDMLIVALRINRRRELWTVNKATRRASRKTCQLKPRLYCKSVSLCWHGAV